MSQIDISTNVAPQSDVNVSYSFTPVVKNGSGTQTWSITTGALPSGLSLNTSSGVISGTPTTTGSTNVTLSVTDSTGSSSVPLTLTFNALPTEPASITAVFVSNTSDSYTVPVTGGTAPYTVALTSGTLPQGLSISGNQIVGTPTVDGSSDVVLTVTDSANQSSTLHLTIVVADILKISGTVPHGEVGQTFSFTPTIIGGYGTQSWSVAGTLPQGLALNSSTGVISGTPTTTGSVTLTVSATDATTTASTSYTFNIDSSLVVTLVTPDGYVGQSYSATPTVSGGRSPITYTSSGAFGNGLGFNPSTGALFSQTLSGAGTVSGSITATDANGVSATIAVNFTIFNIISITNTPTPAQVGVVYSFTPTTVGGSGTQNWTVSSGILPAGLTLNPATGEITGTPTTVRDYECTITVTDLSGSASFSYDFNVTLPLSLVGNTASAYQTGSNFIFTPSVTGGAGAITYTATDLPSYLTLNTTTGQLTGTLSTVPSVVSFTLHATDSITTQTLSLSFTTYNGISVSYTPVGYEVGLATSLTPVIKDGFGPQSWSVGTAGLPSGLTINSTSGVISGTPTSAGVYPISVSVTDSVSTTTVSMTLTISGSITLSINAPNGVVGNSYTALASITGGILPFTFSTDIVLGHSLILDATKGSITSSALTDAGNVIGHLTVTDAAGASATAVLNFTISAPISISGTPPQGEVGYGYSYTPTITGGSGSQTYSIINGTLPAGLSGDPSTGVISGIPTSSGSTPFTLKVSDSTGSSSQNLILTIAPAMTASGNFPNAVVGTPYSFTPLISGGLTNKTYALQGSLPAGLQFNSTTGTISGTPTTAANNVTIAINISDANTTLQITGTMNVYSPALLSGSIPLTYVNTAMSFTPTVSGGNGPKSFALSSGTLPTGLNFDPITGSISGMVTQDIVAPIAISITDTTGTSSQTFTIQIIDHLVISGQAPLALVGETYTFSPTVSGGSGNYTFHLTGNLPAGFLFNTASGMISGITENIADPVNSTIYVYDGYESQSLSISIGVDEAISISGQAPIGVSGEAYSFTPVISGGSGVKSYTVTGTLPTGVQFDSPSATFVGLPTSAGVFTPTLTVSDQSGSRQQSFTITIGDQLSISGNVPSAVIAHAYQFTPVVAGGRPSQSFQISGPLPTGLSFDTTTGTIEGIPTTTGQYTIVISVTDGIETATLSALLNVYNPLAASGSFPEGAMGLAYTFTLSTSQGSGVRTFSLTQGQLPNGLSLDPTLGVITGTPTVYGSFPVTLSVTDKFTTVSVSGVIVIANIGSIPNGTITSNDVQILDFMQQFRTISAQSDYTSTDLRNAMILLGKITLHVIAAPTQVVLQALWQLHMDFQSTMFRESNIFINLALLDQSTQTQVMAVYTAYRGCVLTPSYVKSGNLLQLLQTTNCRPMMLFLAAKINRVVN